MNDHDQYNREPEYKVNTETGETEGNYIFLHQEKTVRETTKLRAFLTGVGTTAMVDGINIVVSIIAAVIVLVSLIGTKGYSPQVMEEMVFIVAKYAYTLTAAYMIVAFLLLLVILKARKVDIIKTINIKKIALPFGFVYILFMPLAYTLSLFTNHIMDLMSKYMAMPGLEAAREISNLNSDPLWYKVLVIAIMAPFFEEFVFRGLIFSKLKEAFPIWFSIGFQAFLFGVYHMNIVQGIYAMVLGIVLGYMVHIYDNLWPGIVMHVTINGFSTIMAHLFADQADVVTPVQSNLTFIGGGFAGFAILMVIVIFINKKFMPKKEHIRI